MFKIWRPKSDQAYTGKSTEVMRRVARLSNDFDPEIISRELDASGQKTQFGCSWDLTQVFLRQLQAAQWGNAAIRTGPSPRVFFVFRVLQETFHQEADAFIRSHPEYPVLRKDFEAKTQELGVKQPDYHKHEFLFRAKVNKLLDGTIVWHMSKFMGKMHKAICSTRTPEERRRDICTAIDILDIGLTSHFPAAERRAKRSPRPSGQDGSGIVHRSGLSTLTEKLESNHDGE